MATLIVFAKAAQPGRVKTRLIPALGALGAAQLYRGFVEDILTRFCGVAGIDVWLSCAPDPAQPFFTELQQRYPIRLVHQGDGDLGPRMDRALKSALTTGAGPAVLIGTDLPTLPRQHVVDSLTQLSHHPLVLSPTRDGGYYLIGAAPEAVAQWDAVQAALFGDLPWSTETVFAESLRRGAALDIALGPAWYDVDEPVDLAHLVRVLAEQPGLDAPHTRAALAALGQ